MMTTSIDRPDLQDCLRQHGKEALVAEAESAQLGHLGGRFRCPFDGCKDQDDKRNRNVSIYIGQGGIPRAKCHRCSTGGSLVDLLMATRGWTQNEAISHVLGISTPAKRPALRAVKTVALIDPGKLSPGDVRSAWDSLARTAADQMTLAYLEKRGIDGAVETGHLRIATDQCSNAALRRLASRGYTIASLASDISGAPLGIQLRLAREPKTRDEPKILSLKGSRMSGAWFGDPGGIEGSDGMVAVCEGLADTAAVSLWAGREAVVVGAPGKDHLHHLAEEINSAGLAENVEGKIFVLFPQNDRPANRSRREFRRLAEHLNKMGAWVVVSSVPDEYKDVAEWRIAEIEQPWPPRAVTEALERASSDEPESSSPISLTGHHAIPVPEEIRVDCHRQDFATLCALLDDPVDREVILGSRAPLAVDERTGEFRIGERTMTDRDLCSIRLAIAKHERTIDGRVLKFGVAEIADALKIVAGRNLVHPVREWLDKLTWDRERRLDDGLPRALGIDPGSFHAVLLRRWMVGLIARPMKPGCQHDSVLVLVGPQGVGKSSFFRALTAPWFSDDQIRLDDKDAKLILLRAWVLEWAELDSMRRARDQETIKAFLSQQEDQFRPPYGRTVESHKRSCVIVGTTNNIEFLSDPTGNRRFWPVPVSSVDVQWVASNREQLLAEAKDRFLAGERWWLDAGEFSLLSESSEEHVSDHDPWSETINRRLLGRDQITTADILDEILEKPRGQWTRFDQMRISLIMKKKGWEKSLGGKTRIVTWSRPPAKEQK